MKPSELHRENWNYSFRKRCPFFQRDFLDEIVDLIESVSKGFHTEN